MNFPLDTSAPDGSSPDERVYPRDYRRFGSEGLIPMFPAGSASSVRFQTLRTIVQRTDSEAVLPVKALIFHCSRCGSTLLARLLELDAGLRVFAEPDALPRFLEAHAASLVRAEATAELRGFIRAFGLAPRPGEHGLVLKLTSHAIAYVAAFRRAFPSVPFVYLFRDPVEVVASLQANPPKFLRDSQRAALAAEFDPDTPAVMNFEPVRWCAWYVDRNFRTAFRHRHEFSTVVDYAQHAPAYVALLRRFGTSQASWTEADVARVLGRHSKNPRIQFGPALVRRLPLHEAEIVQEKAGEAHALWRSEAAARAAR